MLYINAQDKLVKNTDCILLEEKFSPLHKNFKYRKAKLVSSFGEHSILVKNSIPWTLSLQIVFLGFGAAPVLTSSNERLASSSSSDCSKICCKLQMVSKENGRISFFVIAKP